MSNHQEWIHLRPYGYAPGHYTGKCVRCGYEWIDQDKRAMTCKQCATELFNKDQVDKLAKQAHTAVFFLGV